MNADLQFSKRRNIIKIIVKMKFICQLLQMHCNLHLIWQVLSPYFLQWSIHSKFLTWTILLMALSCCPTFSAGLYCNTSVACICILEELHKLISLKVWLLACMT